MHTVLNVALPVFAVILVGWISGRAGLLGRASSEALNTFVYWIALPPLLFLAMAQTPVSKILHLPFIGAFLGGILVIWVSGALIGWVLGRSRAAILTMQGMNASFSNTGYMGIPVFVAAFGAAGLPPASLATVIMSAICVGIAVVSLEFAEGGRKGPFWALVDVAWALIRNPLVVAPVLGVGWSALDIPIPEALASFCRLTGNAAGPSALFAIGLFLAGQSIRHNLADVIWISILKLVWQPLVTLGLASFVFPMDPFWTASAVILAALPTGALTFVVAQNYGVYVERTSAVILVSTIMSVATLSILLAIYVPRFAS